MNLLTPPATVHSDDGKTAFIRYQPYAHIEPTFRGPMPTRMARAWVLFLNGHEFPSQEAVASGRRSARPEYA